MRKNNGIMYNILIIILKFVLKILYRYEIKGKENIPKEGAFILCANHSSYGDPVLLIVASGIKVYYMAKDELFNKKFLGWLIKKLGAFPVKRGKGDKSAINTAESIVKNGKVLGIFIEGTRSKDGEFLRPKSGAALIAYNMKTDVLPACITCKSGGPVRMFKKTVISFGPIIKDLKIEKGLGMEYRNASRMIMDEIKKLRDF